MLAPLLTIRSSAGPAVVSEVTVRIVRVVPPPADAPPIFCQPVFESAPDALYQVSAGPLSWR